MTRETLATLSRLQERIKELQESKAILESNDRGMTNGAFVFQFLTLDQKQDATDQALKYVTRELAEAEARFQSA